MRIECTQLKEQTKSFGIGTDMQVGDGIWAFYPVDLSCEDKYTGYILDPNGVSHHVIRHLLLDKLVHLWIRKVRKDRGMTRPVGTIISITDTHITIDTGKKWDAWCLRTEGCGIENYHVGDVVKAFIQDNRVIKIIDIPINNSK